MTIPLPATTTVQRDLTAVGQRHINAMWERTQQIIAVMVTTVTMSSCAFLLVKGPPDLRTAAFSLMSTLVGVVLTFYFQRTNHTKTGGVGPHEPGR